LEPFGQGSRPQRQGDGFPARRSRSMCTSNGTAPRRRPPAGRETRDCVRQRQRRRCPAAEAAGTGVVVR
jgi:hypothetical protein